MAGEYWAGWFDHWGDKHARTDAKKEADDIDWMLRKGYSVSIYMFHGGTSFGWMNGANSDGKNYQPDVTSYDYDAPLDESGRPTAKYNLFRYVIGKATGDAPLGIREPKPSIQVGVVPDAESVSLWSTLPAPVHSRESTVDGRFGPGVRISAVPDSTGRPGVGRVGCSKTCMTTRRFISTANWWARWIAERARTI